MYNTKQSNKIIIIFVNKYVKKKYKTKGADKLGLTFL